MSLQSVAHPDIAKVHTMLSKMDGPQLQQFAAAHQDNAVYVSLAMQVDKDRKEQMQRLQALMTGQEQPKIIPQAVAALNPQGMAPPGMGAQGQGGAPMPPPGGPQGQPPPQGMPPQGPPGMQMPPASPPLLPEQQGIGQLPAPNMEQMADGGIAGYADGGVVHMQAGGVLGEPMPMPMGEPNEAEIRRRGRAQGMADAEIDQIVQEQTQRRQDAAALGSGLSKTYAAAKDILTMPGRGLAGAAESIVTRPLRSLGVPIPYLPDSFYGGDRTSPTPYMDEIRRKELSLAPPTPNAPTASAAAQPAAQAAAKPGAGAKEGTPAAEGPAITLESLYPLTGIGSPTRTGRAGRSGAGTGTGAGAGAGAGLPTLFNPNAGVVTPGAGAADKALATLISQAPVGGPPTLDMPEKLTPAEAMQNVGEFFDPKELYKRADRATAEKLGRAEETAAFVRQNKPGLPFQELAKKLDTEEFNEISEKEKAKGMALMMAGFKMMESPYGGKGLGAALRNIGAGATVGAKELQQANKEFKELAQKRMQMRTTIEAAQDAAKRGDFDREISLRARADQIEDSAEDNKMRIGEVVWGNRAQGALSAYNHSENVYNQFRLEGFKASNEAYLSNLREAGANTRLGITQAGETERFNAGQMGQNIRHAESERGATMRLGISESGANARNKATIDAARDAKIFEATLPPEAIRAAGYVGGAKPGTLPTPANVKAGLEIMNAEKFNPYTSYSKYLTDWKADYTRNANDRMMTFPEYLAMFGAGKVVDKLPANATVRNPQ